MKDRRILIITPSGTNLGGSEVMLKRFLSSAKAEGLSVHLIFLEDGDHYEEIKNAGHSCDLVKSKRLRRPFDWLHANREVTLSAEIMDWSPTILSFWQSGCARWE